MQKISAGILLYRLISGSVEFFLVHPGGPYFKNKDDGSWTIPKGEQNDDEGLTQCALREFMEETGIQLSEPLIPLTPVKQKGGKMVYAWACQKTISPEQIVSNTFELEWPPHSGRTQQFQEIDRADWFPAARALEKINPAQRSFIIEVIGTAVTQL